MESIFKDWTIFKFLRITVLSFAVRQIRTYLGDSFLITPHSSSKNLSLQMSCTIRKRYNQGSKFLQNICQSCLLRRNLNQTIIGFSNDAKTLTLTLKSVSIIYPSISKTNKEHFKLMTPHPTFPQFHISITIKH